MIAEALSAAALACFFAACGHWRMNRWGGKVLCLGRVPEGWTPMGWE